MSSYFFGGFSAYCTRAVGPPAEPLGVLADPRDDPARTERRCRARFRARALSRVQRDRRKSSIVPSRGWIAVWPPSAGADRPRAAWIVGGGLERIVAALAMLAADRMDRRQIQHVEAHVRDIGQARLAIGERAVRAGRRRSRSAGTARTTRRSVRARGRRSRAARPRASSQAAVGITRGQRGEGLVLSDARSSDAGSRSVRRRCAQACEAPRVVAAGARRGGGDEIGSGCAPRRATSSASTRRREIVSPRQEGVDPRGHGVAVDCRARSTVNAPRQRSLPSARIGASCQRVFVLAPIEQQARELHRDRRQSSRLRPSIWSPTMRFTAKRPPSTTGVNAFDHARGRDRRLETMRWRGLRSPRCLRVAAR